MKEEIINYVKKVETINECLVDYSDPLYISGKIYDLDKLEATTISATIPKEELIILNNKYPNWLTEIIKKEHNDNNILIINDFEKITFDKQKMFMDIIVRNYISSIKLPSNLKIIINSDYKCELIPELNEIIQYFDM